MSVLYRDDNVRKAMFSALAREIHDATAGTAQIAPNILVNFSGKTAIHPKAQDLRLVIGHADLHYKGTLATKFKRLRCKMYVTWWIDDTYDFNKKFFNIGKVKFPEDILRAQVKHGLAGTFQVKAGFYSRHMPSLSAINGVVKGFGGKWKPTEFSEKPWSDSPELPQDVADAYSSLE